jgi:hypothetical protein
MTLVGDLAARFGTPYWHGLLQIDTASATAIATEERDDAGVPFLWVTLWHADRPDDPVAEIDAATVDAAEGWIREHI